jgi:hypothetical protein
MAPQLPEFRPEKVAEAFAAFPPKLSAIQEVLAEPERIFEEQVAATTGVSLPPGPNRMLLQLMQTIEAGAPAGFAPPFGGEGAGEQTYTGSTGSQKKSEGIDI